MSSHTKIVTETSDIKSPSHPTVFKGILLMLLAYFFFGSGNAIVKAGAPSYTISQLLFSRCFFMLIPLLAYALTNKKQSLSSVLKTPFLGSHCIRGFLATLGLWGIFYGFKVLPFATGTAIGFSEIMFMTIFSIPFLKEAVSLRQWISIAIGFIGVLIVARPDTETLFDVTNLGIICMFLGACLDGIVLLYPRKMGKHDSMLTILVYYAIFGTLFSFIGVLYEGWNPVDSIGWIFLIGIALFSLFGQAAATFSFQFASAGVLSPMIYSLILWATLFGYLFWGEIPDVWTTIGSCFIILSGVYIIFSERKAPK